MIYLDATSIDTFKTCRESYRQRNLEKRAPLYPSIHLQFGSAVHLAVEKWHKGFNYNDCMSFAVAEMELLDEGALRPDDQKKWQELGYALSDVVAVYCDTIKPETDAEIEQEFMHPYNSEVTIVGKIDRYHRGVLTDVKTASEVGERWKSIYRSTSLRAFQFGLYDWYERQRSNDPLAVKVECIVKPYGKKKARVEIFDLPEILVYRQRFDHDLAWVISEITEYHKYYSDQKPWPLASNQICMGKFSQCNFLPLCNLGETEKQLRLYTERKEHLECMRNLKKL